MNKTKSVRFQAVEILESIEKNQAYSNLLINHAIEDNRYSNVDAALLTELTYGTLQRKMTLDYYLEPFIQNQKRLESWVRQVLRISVYQMKYLTKIPDRAILFEAVEIAKKKGHKGIANFVNGVLRSIQRKGLPSLDEIQDPIEKLAIETSHPLWLVKRWVNQFGFDRTKDMCFENLVAPHQTARVNICRTTVEDCIKKLEKEGYIVEKSSSVPDAIRSLKGNIAKSSCYKEGLLTIQDESSMLVGYAMNPKVGETILDACAAPGGKTTHIAEKLNNTGKITALDLHKHKVKLIKENANRLHLENIETKVMDSRKVRDHFSNESFDRILVDAPCSGLGVLKRKPDIKYAKVEADVEKLSDIQLNILSACAPLLKKGGLLVYSTCTVDRTENSGVAKRFLQHHPEFEMDVSLVDRMPKAIQPFIKQNEIEILPQDLKSDGFYIACFKKKV